MGLTITSNSQTNFNNQNLESFTCDPKIYDPKGILNSGELQPHFAQKVQTLVEEACKQGLKISIFEGLRTIDEQNQLPGTSTNAKGGQSFHNYGLAVDFVFLDDKGNPSWDDKHDWQKLGEIGKGLDLGWGGDFKNIYDPGHFEYHPDLTIKQVQNINEELGLQSVWIKI